MDLEHILIRTIADNGCALTFSDDEEVYIFPRNDVLEFQDTTGTKSFTVTQAEFRAVLIALQFEHGPISNVVTVGTTPNSVVTSSNLVSYETTIDLESLDLNDGFQTPPRRTGSPTNDILCGPVPGSKEWILEMNELDNQLDEYWLSQSV